MQGEQLRRRSYEQDFGGRLCTKTPKYITERAMSVRGWGDHREEMNFH